MQKKNTGQSFLEYTAITMFLIGALILMGPFIKNSVNAHFKILNDSVQDAANEVISK